MSGSIIYSYIANSELVTWACLETSWGFWRIADNVLSEGKSAIPPLFNDPEVQSSASDKAKLFAKSFSKNCNLDDLDISLPVFPFRTNEKLHIISVTHKMVQKVKKKLDSSKGYDTNCIPVMVLKTCQLALSYILAELFQYVWSSLVFQIAGRSHRCSLYLRMLGKGLQVKTVTLLAFFL